jgi:hypothetical protein
MTAVYAPGLEIRKLVVADEEPACTTNCAGTEKLSELGVIVNTTGVFVTTDIPAELTRDIVMMPVVLLVKKMSLGVATALNPVGTFIRATVGTVIDSVAMSGALTVIEATPGVIEVVRGICTLSVFCAMTALFGTAIIDGFDDDNVRFRAVNSSAGVDPIIVVTTRASYV